MIMVHRNPTLTSAIFIKLAVVYVWCFSRMSWAYAEGDVRLVGGAKPNEGRVEIHNEGVWGTYCGDSIDVQIGMVICRQAGYPGVAMRFQTSQEFGPGTGPVYYSGYVSCAGDEKSLAQCFFLRYRYAQCNHEKDAGVICQEPGYQGCYPADGSNFQPILSLSSSSGSDSVDDCLSVCRSKNMSFAAMSGRNCHCSSQLPSNISSSRVTDDRCNTTCSGNSRQICGGPEHYSLFSTTDGFCDTLTPPANGTIDTTFTRYGTTVSFDCFPGFELEGANRTQCVRNETHPSGYKWDSVTPICTVSLSLPSATSIPKVSTSTGGDITIGLMTSSEHPSHHVINYIGICIPSGLLFLVIIIITVVAVVRKRRKWYSQKKSTASTLEPNESDNYMPLHVKSGLGFDDGSGTTDGRVSGYRQTVTSDTYQELNAPPQRCSGTHRGPEKARRTDDNQEDIYPEYDDISSTGALGGQQAKDQKWTDEDEGTVSSGIHLYGNQQVIDIRQDRRERTNLSAQTEKSDSEPLYHAYLDINTGESEYIEPI